MLSVGEVGLGIGAGLAALGVVLAVIDDPKFQDGSAAQFPLTN
jgi:hypothetical protein